VRLDKHDIIYPELNNNIRTQSCYVLFIKLNCSEEIKPRDCDLIPPNWLINWVSGSLLPDVFKGEKWIFFLRFEAAIPRKCNILCFRRLYCRSSCIWFVAQRRLVFCRRFGTVSDPSSGTGSRRLFVPTGLRGITTD